MLVPAMVQRSASAHMVVLGNEKGGSGKSTTAIHVAIALLNLGQRVATIDLDSRQKTLTHYIENRRQWASHARVDLNIPIHFCVARGTTIRLDDNESIEFSGFADAVTSVEQACDFIVVDTPGADDYLMRLAHSMADTLISPLNDSFVDLDVLGKVDPATFAVTGESHYAEMVRDARRHRRLTDGAQMDWVVVRNRLSVFGSRNKRLVGQGLNELSAQLGFRCIDGFADRVIFREYFPRGLTALDGPDEATLGTRPGLAHLAARQEMMGLIAALKLPLNARGQGRAVARAEWSLARGGPLELHGVLDD